MFDDEHIDGEDILEGDFHEGLPEDLRNLSAADIERLFGGDDVSLDEGVFESALTSSESPVGDDCFDDANASFEKYSDSAPFQAGIFRK